MSYYYEGPDGIVLEFNYVVGQSENEEDKFVYRDAADEDAAWLPFLGSDDEIPAEVAEHFFGPVYKRSSFKFFPEFTKFEYSEEDSAYALIEELYNRDPNATDAAYGFDTGGVGFRDMFETGGYPDYSKAGHPVEPKDYEFLEGILYQAICVEILLATEGVGEIEVNPNADPADIVVFAPDFYAIRDFIKFGEPPCEPSKSLSDSNGRFCESIAKMIAYASARKTATILRMLS